MVTVFDALAAPARRAILDELRDRDGQTLYELCVRLTMKHQLDLTRQAVSQHLAVDDQEKALRFYTDVLGFRKKMDVPLGHARWLTVVSPNAPFSQPPVAMGPVTTAVFEDTCGNLIQIAKQG